MTTVPESPAIRPVEAVMWSSGVVDTNPDQVAVEEPLEIRLAGVPVAVTMRTPGDDLDLAAGFLFTEGIVRSPAEIATIAHCETDDPATRGNVVNLNPTDPALVEPSRWERHFVANSACGVCGKAGIERITVTAPPITAALTVEARVLLRSPDALRERQRGFDRTGGLHAAGLFDAHGGVIVAREDVGRHNAVDKVIGAMVRNGQIPLSRHVLVVSSRASFEIVQKALVAGIPAVATMSAPSSLAVDLARTAGMTLIGFLRGTRFNVYTSVERVAWD